MVTAERETMSVPEAARRLGISRNSAYAAIQRGELFAVRIGHRLVVPKRAVDRLLDGPAPDRGAAPELTATSGRE